MANGILPPLVQGMQAAKKEKQEDIAFNLDVQAAQQNLYAKSLEIQDYIDSTKYRETQRRVDTKKLESEERLLPEQEKLAQEVLAAEREQTKMLRETAREEDLARDLFHLDADNYNDQFGNLPQPVVKKLGLTGNWAEDGYRIIQSREAAINNAAHMRAMRLSGLRASGRGGSMKAQAIKLAKANEQAVHNMMANDKVYKTLSSDYANSYRSNITYLAMDLYQKQQDRIKNGSTEQPIPFITYVNQVKAIADKHVAGDDSLFAGILNRGEFDSDGFQTEVASAFGVGIPKEAMAQLEAGEVEGVDMYEGPQAAVPPSVQAGVQRAQDVIRQYRIQKGVPTTVPDHVIFNGLVEANYLNPDGTLAEQNAPKRRQRRGQQLRSRAEPAPPIPKRDVNRRGRLRNIEE